jgi:hypothetical protein
VSTSERGIRHWAEIIIHLCKLRVKSGYNKPVSICDGKCDAYQCTFCLPISLNHQSRMHL